ncbi:MAG TPA: efflux RND transporter periplasmic adaptor subunit [Candidatus Paceibacterota bacterium]|nr:efflux RND transporter periplasmic adaptor subunit [Candidatus Paceibacterota bacterium]
MTFFSSLRRWLATHKKSSIFGAIVIVVIVYLVVHHTDSASTETRYVLANATVGTIVQSVSATGQMTTSASLDLKPQTSGTLIAIKAHAGDKVVQGETLFVIDPSDATQALHTAQNNLAQAKLDLASTQTQTANNQADLQKAVQDAHTTLLSSGLSATPADFNTAAFTAPTVSGNYTLDKEGTLTVATYASQGGISFEVTGMGVDVYGYASNINPQPIIGTGLFLTFPNNTRSGLKWNIAIPNTSAPSYLSNKNAYDTAVENLNESQQSANSSAVTLQSKELAVTEAAQAVTSAQQTLDDCYVKAPFDGVLASVDAIVGDTASSGTALGTVITNQKIAQVTLNEVDVAKVAIGDKATLTFDALPDITLTGTVSQIDTVGTVSQGVVNYTVDITLDTDNDAVKSGMSVTASIITASKSGVLTVPSSAVKSNANGSYVLVLDTPGPATAGVQGVTSATPPREVSVTTGISDTTTTEIVSGLTEGEQLVARTVAATPTSTSSSSSSAPSLFGGGGGVRVGGGGAAGTVRTLSR